MHIDAIHVGDIGVLDQTFWWLQSFTVKLEMNDPLSVEFETSSRCIDHLDKSCTLIISSVNIFGMCKLDVGQKLTGRTLILMSE